MSAIGQYAVVSRAEFPGCIALAEQVRTEASGWWIFKQSRIVGLDEFRQAWAAAVARTMEFENSGYALGSYLEVQQEVNALTLVDEESRAARALSRVFTAGFPFESPVILPELSDRQLLAYCRDEWGESGGDEQVAALRAADAFYRSGLSNITSEHVIVFLIA